MSADDYLESLRHHFMRFIPHVAEIGIELDAATAEGVDARLPMRPEFVGDIDRGRIHTGIVTTLIDSVAGAAVYARLGAPESIATLDLRVDHLGPADVGTPLTCRAECYRLTRQIAFVRAEVRQGDTAVAAAQLTFMRHSRRREKPAP